MYAGLEGMSCKVKNAALYAGLHIQHNPLGTMSSLKVTMNVSPSIQGTIYIMSLIPPMMTFEWNAGSDIASLLVT